MNPKRSLLRVCTLGFAVAAVLLAACGAPRDTQKNACVGEGCDTGGTPLGGCTRDEQCPPEQVCVGGACGERNDGGLTDCTSNNDCPVSLYCRVATGLCVQCLNDDQCYEPGEVCRSDGTCGEPGAGACTGDADCGGLVCDIGTGTCVQCLDSADCPIGQTCRDKVCFVTDGGAPLCAAQTDCDPYGKICDTAEGRCRSCTDNPECGTGRVCSGGTCTFDDGGSSVTGDGTCATRDDCGGMACFLGFCMPCFSDFMCVDIMDLFSGTTMICDPYSGNCVAPECSTAYDCAAGQACYSSHCGECMYDDECRSGEVCNTSTGVCGGGGDGTTPTCTSNAQCSGGMVCVSGACGACTSSTQCSGGNVCVSGACGACTSSTQCDAGMTCTAGVCQSGSTGGSATLGSTCAAPEDCDTGFVCLSGAAGAICTRTCIGSGAGGDADCPTGYACQNFESGLLDGVKLCNAAGGLPADYPGQPFTQAPGASCADGNACQTSVCFSDSLTCGRGCAANRDCDSGEVCWAVTNGDGTMLGHHLCFDSDTSLYKPAGAACGENWECDSGLCAGTCSDGSSCNNSAQCGGGACTGTCRDHCRSNADCGTGQSCDPWAINITATGYSGWVPTCGPRYFDGTQADGTTCNAHSSCASDWCVGGICTTPCAVTGDCTGALTGRKCEPMRFVDSNDDPLFALAFCL